MFTWVYSLFGGCVIGCAVGGMWMLNNRIAGNSGILGALVKRQVKDSNDLWYRLAYIFAMVATGVGMQAQPTLRSVAFSPLAALPLWIYLGGGLCVGFGTSMGNGCTAGHGLCGLSRFSVRSLAATATFVCFGFLVGMVSHFEQLRALWENGTGPVISGLKGGTAGELEVFFWTTAMGVLILAACFAMRKFVDKQAGQVSERA